MEISEKWLGIERTKNVPVHISHHLLVSSIEAKPIEVSVGFDAGHGVAHSQDLEIRWQAVVASAVQVPLGGRWKP